MKERLALTAVIVAILVGPVAMLFVAYAGTHTHYHHKPEPPQAPSPVTSVRSV